MHLAQNIVKPSLNVTLGVELFCRGVQLFENFTLCDLNYFDIILRNTLPMKLKNFATEIR